MVETEQLLVLTPSSGDDPVVASFVQARALGALCATGSTLQQWADARCAAGARQHPAAVEPGAQHQVQADHQRRAAVIVRARV